MFTGIIEEAGVVLEAGGGALRVQATRILEDAKLGDSIAVNGVDLTVSDLDSTAFRANVMPETFSRTNLAEFRPGRRVNLERSLRAADRLSGHIVRGVVEATGVLEAIEPDGDALLITFSVADELLRHIVTKGPVAVDGASLTVTARGGGRFTVSLVQYTQQNTTLLDLVVGDRVNIETDLLARYIDNLLEERLGNGPRA